MSWLTDDNATNDNNFFTGFLPSLDTTNSTGLGGLNAGLSNFGSSNALNNFNFLSSSNPNSSFLNQFNTPNMGNNSYFPEATNFASNLSMPGGGTYNPSMWDKVAGWKDPKTGAAHGGIGMPVLQAAMSGMNTFIGLKSLGIAKKTLKFQKNAFSKQFEAQRKTVNNELERKHRMSLSALSPKDKHLLEDMETYMKKHRV